MSETAHPSPQRWRASPVVLFAALFAAPAIWLAHLTLANAIANYSCRPGFAFPLAGVYAALWTINIIALGASGVAALTGFRVWRATRHEHPSSTAQLVDIGEGRTRFLALIGWLAGAGFAVAILFDVAMLALAPRCVL